MSLYYCIHSVFHLTCYHILLALLTRAKHYEVGEIDNKTSYDAIRKWLDIITLSSSMYITRTAKLVRWSQEHVVCVAFWSNNSHPEDDQFLYRIPMINSIYKIVSPFSANFEIEKYVNYNCHSEIYIVHYIYTILSK